MKLVLVAALLAVPACAQQPLRTLPAACGPSSTIFAVTTDGTPGTGKPETGKALVYFIQDDGPNGSRQHFTLRIGLDGSWVGAYKNNAYFTISVEPGVHHVCASVQSKNTSASRNVALAHFTAEAGKVYYFRTKFLAGLTTVYPIYPDLILDRPDSDEAEYLIASYPVSVSHPPK